MSQGITLQPGDYVSVEDLTMEEYNAVAKAFVDAGCEDPFDHMWASGYYSRRKYLEWYHTNLCAANTPERDGRRLKVADVLNSGTATINTENRKMKEVKMRDWKPEEGKPALLRWDEDGVPVVVKAIDDESERVAVQEDHGYISIVDIESLAPPMTEEDEAVKEMRRIFDEGVLISIDDRLRNIYRAGYRKQPVHLTEDMTDPANWREGDWLKCNSDGPDLTANKIYQVLRMDFDNDPVIDDDADESVARPACHFRFHSRPE